MTIQEVINYFGTAYQLSKHGFGHTTAYHWVRQGWIPIKAQQKIEALTEGKLKASLDHCPKSSF
jgi:hypothetical protein